MPLKIVLVAATSSEADTLKKVPGIQVTSGTYLYEGNVITPVVTGVGSVATAWAMTKFISSGSEADLAINIGIAGSFRDDIPVGEVVVPVSDCFADAGIGTATGFLTLAEAGLVDPDAFPFKSGKLVSENRFVSAAVRLLRPVNAITVNTSTGSQDNIKKISERYHNDIETMEGAAFFYVCSREEIPFLALRAVSNRVEPRNRDKWNIPLALENLSEKLGELLLSFE
ncbi:MAG TPA: futalosine hydrolase [Bacteroidales bacterium]|jgi:futalosine hydrolase|nr:futalosine hydrolase [Bacteroidales bacterium]HBZ22546.1 futalosine hydrolase [Bacteroidales bacterium]